jgi:hypothetical protein
MTCFFLFKILLAYSEKKEFFGTLPKGSVDFQKLSNVSKSQKKDKKLYRTL